MTEFQSGLAIGFASGVASALIFAAVSLPWADREIREVLRQELRNGPSAKRILGYTLLYGAIFTITFFATQAGLGTSPSG